MRQRRLKAPQPERLGVGGQDLGRGAVTGEDIGRERRVPPARRPRRCRDGRRRGLFPEKIEAAGQLGQPGARLRSGSAGSARRAAGFAREGDSAAWRGAAAPPGAEAVGASIAAAA